MWVIDDVITDGWPAAIGRMTMSTKLVPNIFGLLSAPSTIQTSPRTILIVRRLIRRRAANVGTDESTAVMIPPCPVGASRSRGRAMLPPAFAKRPSRGRSSPDAG